MAIVFALRADNAGFNARYSLNSTAPQQMGTGIITYDVDATAINGHNFNLQQAAAATRVLQYPFRGCLTTKAFSVLMRIQNPAAALFGYWHIGNANGYSVCDTAIYQNSNLYQMVMFNDQLATIKNGSSGITPNTGQWDDVVLTWDGTTGANKLQLWVNGVATQFTAGAANPVTTFHDCIAIGGITAGVPNAKFLIEEFVVWNTEIDPTSVTLNSGTGSLNGPSRVSLVSVNALNGGSYTDPGIANVSAGTGYTYAGTVLTGTLASAAGGSVCAGFNTKIK